jgi:hypothetical protein
VIDKREQKEAAMLIALAKRKGEREKQQAQMNPWKYNKEERKEIQGLSDAANSFNVKYSVNEKEKSQVF